MRRFEFWLPQELYDRIKLMAKYYNKPVSKAMIELLEIGYIRKYSEDVEWEKKHTFILMMSYISK